MLSAAIAFATKAHEGQVRRGSGLPYITHPLEVMVLLFRHGVLDEATLVAAVLHDVVEDCDVPATEIAKRFGLPVAEIVEALTKPEGGAEADRKRRALELVRRGPAEARVVKLADRLSNLLDLEDLGWPPERKLAYRREALEIAEIGAKDHPDLAEVLRRVAHEGPPVG